MSAVSDAARRLAEADATHSEACASGDYTTRCATRAALEAARAALAAAIEADEADEADEAAMSAEEPA